MQPADVFLNDGEAGEALAGIDWRELGLIHGGPYFLAALCLYASSAMVAQARHGAMTWYLMGCAAGFPCIYLVDFEAGWWRDPSPAEGMVAGTGVIALLLAVAVWDLRKRTAKPAQDPGEEEQMVMVPASVAAAGFPALSPKPKAKPKRPKGPTSAAVLATRAQFARDGAKMLEREKARAARRKP